MPNKVAIRPWIGTFERIGAPIEAPGWGQRYSSPYIRPINPPNPDYYHAPTRSARDVRGRHPFRTQPRELGPYVFNDPVAQQRRNIDRSSSIVSSVPNYAHGFGAVDPTLVAAGGHALFALSALWS